MHINVTGKFDEETNRMMRAPRCGRPDIETQQEEKTRRSRRNLFKRGYTHGTKWLKSVR